MVGILVSFWDCLFSWAVLVLGSVSPPTNFFKKRCGWWIFTTPEKLGRRLSVDEIVVGSLGFLEQGRMSFNILISFQFKPIELNSALRSNSLLSNISMFSTWWFSIIFRMYNPILKEDEKTILRQTFFKALAQPPTLPKN